ncbi:Putative glutamyl-tRNA amidotransferase subunit A [Alloalcanivorax dieselolei B5]|uniref:Putative glutamyl-tRNA amidotransferase subunit A n=1 Tax=Alcanivorax dieselolei (strain DSM 16502 / CGMCC 1.3690 / MCCC 1A00001 / B-5) TaxID=930169 RepID=K0CFE7_ALCDB|nr:amidase [Alloalcanivorax dieselolei]AFT72244.1 Putative glutamyl-tRNA amidotransferase subunit A [Alloalcanivorax dieselolei B5]GGJ76362.1 amidase [Alloalcanivorax dieselolei]
MTIRKPQYEDLLAADQALGLGISKADIQAFTELLEEVSHDYAIVDALTPELPEVRYPRTPGHYPAPAENPYNAWYVKSEVKGRPGGQLEGLNLALKDNVMLAGVPMMAGASSLRGYTPDVDATLVTRLLDQGATILGKAQCEYFCVSGSSHTSAQGPVKNPWDEARSAGGSSSGCSALVSAGLVDAAIGTDQGGSVRIPAAYAGFVGMKPTHGVVPYTGVMPVEMTLDHAGVMSGDVRTNARVLEAIVGDDGLDPRQRRLPDSFDYLSQLEAGATGLRIAIIAEGFGWENSEEEVDAAVRAGAERLRSLGATVDQVSLPLHRKGHAIWTPIAIEGTANQLEGFNYGSNWKGLYVTSLMRAQQDWRANASDFPADVTSVLLAAHYFRGHYHGQYYAKAQNLVRRLKAAYEAVLADYDLLLMPTVPLKAPRLPDPGCGAREWVGRALEMNTNTAPFNATGLPAISVPCGMAQGLPVGMMLIGRDYTEATLYRAAAAYEAAFDWKTL